MPGFLLHDGAAVLCFHGGQAKSTTPTPRVLVNGQPIVTQPVPFVVIGCPFTVGPVYSPCVTAQWTSASLRIKSLGVPVLLFDSQAVCAPNGTPLIIQATQTRVTGM